MICRNCLGDVKITVFWRLKTALFVSNGLGVHFNKPMSLVLDRTLVFILSTTRPSDLENILNGDISDLWYREQVPYLPKLLAHGITKYNVGEEDALNLLKTNGLFWCGAGGV